LTIRIFSENCECCPVYGDYKTSSLRHVNYI
jgi:hypothetical protein